MKNAASSTALTEDFCAHLFARASREFQLVAACCCWPPDEQRTSHLLASAALDWDSLLHLAERHRVTGLVAAALKGQERVPGEVAERLAKRGRQIQHQNLANVALACRISRAMEADGVPMVILKGAPLSQLAFGTTALRHMRDIDILVASHNVSAAEHLLVSLGFVRGGDRDSISDRHAARRLRFRKHYAFTHPPTGIALELHWRAYDNARLGKITLDEVHWVDVMPGYRLPTLPPQELLLLLCAHGASHAWFRLKWVADIAALLAKTPEQGWTGLVELARARDLDRPLEQAHLLCMSLFGSAAGPALPGESSVTGRWLARVGRDALLAEVTAPRSSEADFVPRRQTLSRFFLRRSWRYRLEEARVHAASPADWQALPLPERLYFLYPFLRVPLWVRRRWFPQRPH